MKHKATDNAVEILRLVLEAIDYSFLQTDGTYKKTLTYPVIDKVLWAKKQLKNNKMKHIPIDDAISEAFMVGYKSAIEKAAHWFEEYLGNDYHIDDWLRDSTVVESGRTKFFKDMEELIMKEMK